MANRLDYRLDPLTQLHWMTMTIIQYLRREFIGRNFDISVDIVHSLILWLYFYTFEFFLVFW